MGHDVAVSASERAAADPTGTAPVLQIGEVARRVDLSIRTIRHWEDMGLITPSARSSGGFRLYSEEDVARIRLLRFMKPLNLTLEQMRELLEIRTRLTASPLDADARIAALVWPRGTGPESDRDALAPASPRSPTWPTAGWRSCGRTSWRSRSSSAGCGPRSPRA